MFHRSKEIYKAQKLKEKNRLKKDIKIKEKTENKKINLEGINYQNKI